MNATYGISLFYQVERRKKRTSGKNDVEEDNGGYGGNEASLTEAVSVVQLSEPVHPAELAESTGSAETMLSSLMTNDTSAADISTSGAPI